MLQFIWKRGIPVEDTGDLSCPWRWFAACTVEVSGRSWWFHDAISIQVAEDMVNSHASCVFCFSGFQVCKQKLKVIQTILKWESYQQTLRVVEYLFLSFGCAFVCHFCFALSFFVVFSSGAGGWTRSRPGKSKNVILPAHESFFCIFCALFLDVFCIFWHFPDGETFIRHYFCIPKPKWQRNDNKIQ